MRARLCLPQHTQRVQALSVHNTLLLAERGYSRRSSEAFPNALSWSKSLLSHPRVMQFMTTDTFHCRSFSSLSLSLSPVRFSHSLQATIIIDENPSSAQCHNSLPSSWICMFSIYSSTLHFRPLYTSWQHVQRRYQHICLISLSPSLRPAAKKKRRTFHSLYKFIHFTLSLSLTWYSSLSFIIYSSFSFHSLPVLVDGVCECWHCHSLFFLFVNCLLFFIPHRHRAHWFSQSRQNSFTHESQTWK